MTHDISPEVVADALTSNVDPNRLEAFGFARSILPAFKLIRALFSQNELNTCLKLMLLYEMSRAAGRFSKERIRLQARYLEAEQVDGLVDSLREGGWLELRASDNTYVLTSEGLQLLALLHAADLGSISPANVLARAAQNAVFGATLDGADGTTSYLLTQLLTLLEGQVEGAQNMLHRGRAFELIRWSRQEHTRQLDIIRKVLGQLQEHIDETSLEFTRIVRLHEAMQSIIKTHTGINARLREWNLQRLYTTESGYAIPQLIEAVLGVDDAALMRTVEQGMIQVPVLPPTLTTDEIRVRLQGVRRKSRAQSEPFVYKEPGPPEPVEWSPADADPAHALLARLTALLAGRTAHDPPLELEEWVEADHFSGIAFELASLSRVQAKGHRIALGDGRLAGVEFLRDTGERVAPGALLAHLVERGVLRELKAGLFARVQLRILDEEVPGE